MSPIISRVTTSQGFNSLSGFRRVYIGRGTAGSYAIERSLRFNSSDSAYLSRTPASAGNRKTWTWAGWVKRSKLGTEQVIWTAGADTDSGSWCSFRFYPSTDQLQFVNNTNGTNNINLLTTQVFRDASAWYHIVLKCDISNSTAGDRVDIYVNGEKITAYSAETQPATTVDTAINAAQIHNIGREAARATYYCDLYLADIHFIDGQALDPTSFGEFDDNNVWQPIAFTPQATPNDGTVWSTATVSAGTIDGSYPVSNAFNGSLSGTNMRSSGANTTITLTLPKSISFSNQIRIYQNQNGTANINSESTVSTSSGGANWVTVYTGSGDFSSLTLTSTGGDTVSLFAVEVDGVILIDGDTANIGTNGFHLPFSDNSTAAALGTDTSGAGNTWTVNNISVTTGAGNDSLVDSPTNYGEDSGAGNEVRGNYCVFNALNKGNDVTLSNGNLQAACTSSSKDGVFGTIGVSSGKWYWEVQLTSSDSETNAAIGIATSVLSPDAGTPESAGAYFYASYNGNKWLNSAGSSYGASYGTGDVIGVALDLDNDTLTFYKNGSTQGDATTSLPSGTYFPYVGDNANNSAQTVVANWGQRSFSYSAPSGFKALCTTNLPAPTIADGSDYFQTKIFTGNGSSTVLTTGFSPDMIWLKSRDSAFSHYLGDIVRGSNKLVRPSSAAEEITTTSGISSFNNDGVTLGSGSETNANNDSMVAWIWDAGSSTVSDEAGSIISQVRANTTSGFSIVTYTGNGTQGATVGHGLNVAPALYFVKARSREGSWLGQHTSISAANHYIKLNETTASATATSIFPQKPTSSLLYLGNEPEVNNNSDTFVAYCFAPVDGYSAMGSYVGNGSSDGVFVYTGFRPRWVLIKQSSASGEAWFLLDTARSPYNVSQEYLVPNASNFESSAYNIMDIVSNGFKLRATGSVSSFNGSGATYIYAAFAEHPFSSARAR